MPTVVLILFLILRERLNLRFLGPSSSKHSSSFSFSFFFFFCYFDRLLRFLFFFLPMVHVEIKPPVERYEMINVFRTRATTQYSHTSHPVQSPPWFQLMYRALRYFGGFVPEKRLRDEDAIFQRPPMNVFNLS